MLWLCFSVYSGHHSILVPPSEVEANPAVWLTSVSNYNGQCHICVHHISDLHFVLVPCYHDMYHINGTWRHVSNMHHTSVLHCNTTSVTYTILQCYVATPGTSVPHCNTTSVSHTPLQYHIAIPHQCHASHFSATLQYCISVMHPTSVPHCNTASVSCTLLQY